MERERLRRSAWGLAALVVGCAHGVEVDLPPSWTGGYGGAALDAAGGRGSSSTGGSGGSGIGTDSGPGGGAAGTGIAPVADASPESGSGGSIDAGVPDTSVVDAPVVMDAGNTKDAAPEIGPPPDAAVGEGPPLSTCGRWIVDKGLHRVKLAGVNWYGASDARDVVGGLDTAPLDKIVSAIKTAGFNTVRLPFSNEMLLQTGTVAPASIAANAALAGKRPIDVYDAVIDAITRAGLYVILLNNTTHSQTCCSYDQDGLWYTSDYSEANWISDWEKMAQRYAGNPRVVGADLRNEPRPYRMGLAGTVLVNWGQGGTNDWAAAAKRAGDRLLAKNPNLLVLVEGIDAADNLTGVRTKPVSLQVPNKLVYEAHQYATFPVYPGDTSVAYAMMSAATLKTTSHDHWGYVMDPNQTFTAPVLLGEFGASTQSTWLASLEAYMKELDMDFAFWALNPTTTAGDAEPFGILQSDWVTVRADARLTALKDLQKPVRGPGIGTSAADACPTR